MSSEALKTVIKDLTIKSEQLLEAVRKCESDLNVISTVCNNVTKLIGEGVKGARAKEKDNLQDAYHTLLANVQVIHETILKEPQRLSVELIKLISKKENLDETIAFLHGRVRAEQQKEQKQMELVDKILKGELGEKRKPGQRPESVKNVRAAKTYIKENNLEQEDEDPVIEVTVDIPIENEATSEISEFAADQDPSCELVAENEAVDDQPQSEK